MPSIFDKIRVGCSVLYLVKNPLVAEPFAAEEWSHLQEGKCYKVIGWQAPDGTKVGTTTATLTPYGIITIQAGAENKHSESGWRHVYAHCVRLVEYVEEDSLCLAHMKRMCASLSAMTDFHDVNLIVGDLTLTAPGLILSAASPVFRSMLATDMREASNRRVVINGSSPGAATAMLRYIMHGELVATPEELPNVAILADQYDLPLLLEATAMRMEVAVTEENVAEFVKTLGLLRHSEVAASAFKRMKDDIRKDEKLYEAFMEHAVAGPCKKRRLEQA